MAYPVPMDTLPSLPPELWERTPPEVQAYIRALEERIVLFEAMVHAFQEQVHTLPEQCQGCHAPLSGDDASPLRHQVMHIAPYGRTFQPSPLAQGPACGAVEAY